MPCALTVQGCCSLTHLLLIYFKEKEAIFSLCKKNKTILLSEEEVLNYY